MKARPINSLKNKKCLITGAASGIGRAVAIAAAAEGADLYLTDINGPGLQAAAAEIGRKGGRVSVCKALDVSDYAAVRAFANEILDVHGSLDVVMNVAGISVWGAIENLEHEHWRKVVEIDLMGPIHVMECFIPPMIKAGRGGHLVNVSSAAGLFGLPLHAPYSAAKFGLRGVSEVLRFDLAHHGIGVSLVCPGAVDTGLVNTVEVHGVDLANPAVVRLRERFRKKAVTPETAARAVIKGIKANRYMVFTSADIRVGYWIQCKFAWIYELGMRMLHKHLHAIMDQAKLSTGSSNK